MRMIGRKSAFGVGLLAWAVGAALSAFAGAFPWRGVHVDEARHFFGKAAIQRVIDRMQKAKLNVLHWHLTDDQGWRLEIKRHPELTRIGSRRQIACKRSREWSFADEVDHGEYGPFFYTQEDVREIVEYARVRGITIVPEIEMPGHSLAALASCPELHCFPEMVRGHKTMIPPRFGTEKKTIRTYCIGNDRTVAFLQDVLDEVCGLFPGKVIHIGGDEAPTSSWAQCPKCHARMEKEGLKDPRQLQGWLMNRFIDYLHRKGKVAMGWEEILIGKPDPKKVIVQCWHKPVDTLRAVEAGYRVVLSPPDCLYFDFSQGLKGDRHFYTDGPVVKLETVRGFTPLAGIPECRHAQVLGAECCNWSERTFTPEALEWKMWPRAAALAEVLNAGWAARPRGVSVENPSFDTPTAWRLDPAFRIEKGAGLNGSGGLVWERPSAGDQQGAIQDLRGWRAGDVYRFSIRAIGSAVPQAQVCIEWYDACGKYMNGGYSARCRTMPAGEWVRLEGVTPPIPPEAVRVNVQITVDKGAVGKCRFDNVVVEPFQRDSVSYVCSDAYRDEADSGKVAFRVVFSPDAVRPGRTGRFTWRAVDGKLRQRTTGIVEGAACFDLDIADLAMGCHDVVGELVDGGSVLGAKNLSFSRLSRLPARRVAIDGHRRCLVNGRPFFPLGMYFSDVRADELAIYAKGPFNALLPYRLPTRAQLDLCAKYGLMCCANVQGPLPDSVEAERAGLGDFNSLAADYRRRMDPIRDHPALLAWYVNDERPTLAIPALSRLQREFFRVYDDQHPTFAVVDRLFDLRDFYPTCDVIGVDPYPVVERPVSYVSEFQAGAVKALFGAKAMWNVPQAFSWGWYRKDRLEERFPTKDEIRSMGWQHIAGGANGLFVYSFFDYRVAGRTLEDFDRYWKTVCEVFGEVRAKIPVMLSVEPVPAVMPSCDDMVCRAWRKDGDVHVLACNRTNRALKASVHLSDGSVRGFDLPPLGVSFVRLERRVGH